MIDIAGCIEKLERVRDACDRAGLKMVGIHITEAIALLEGELQANGNS